jgi:hypothetical protein
MTIRKRGSRKRTDYTQPKAGDPRAATLSDRSFQLLMVRFDAVDKDNQDIKEALKAHAEKDERFYATVNKHSTYWSLLLGLGTPSILGAIAWFNGLFTR